MHQDKHQTYPGIPFKIPFKTMETSRFQQGRKKKWQKHELFLKYVQKTIFSSKYCKVVNFWLGWYNLTKS